MLHVNRRLSSRKGGLGATIVEDAPGRPLGAGQVRLAIDVFALTTNNITYAAFGDAIGYWQVFPTGREGFGAMPVWEFAGVVESRAEGVQIGTRVWGYLPMADELVVDAKAVTTRSFSDGASRRAAVPAVHSRYVRTEGDLHYLREDEPLRMLYRPLFITS